MAGTSLPQGDGDMSIWSFQLCTGRWTPPSTHGWPHAVGSSLNIDRGADAVSHQWGHEVPPWPSGPAALVERDSF